MYSLFSLTELNHKLSSTDLKPKDTLRVYPEKVCSLTELNHELTSTDFKSNPRSGVYSGQFVPLNRIEP